MNVVFAENVLEPSAVCAQLLVPFTTYIFSLPLPLSLPVILVFDFHPVESGVYLWKTVADTRPAEESSRRSPAARLRGHTQPKKKKIRDMDVPSEYTITSARPCRHARTYTF